MFNLFVVFSVSTMVRQNKAAPIHQDGEGDNRWSSLYMSPNADNFHTGNKNGWKYVYVPP